MTSFASGPNAPRPATEAQLGPCRALLPQAFPILGRPPDCLVTMDEGSVAAVGAMAWIGGGFPTQLHVVPRFRGQGLGRAMLAALAARAMGETPALRTAAPIEDGTPADGFLRRCGFTETQRLHVFACDPARLRAAMATLLARLRPRIPPGITLVAPPQAPADAIAALLARSFAIGHEDIAARLAGEGPHAWDPGLSRVLLVAGTVAGTILARRAGPAMEVDFNIVAPEWRGGGWANLLLVEAVLRNGHAAGLSQLRFLAEPHTRDTVNLARRAGATRGPDRVSLSLALLPGALPPGALPPGQ